MLEVEMLELDAKIKADVLMMNLISDNASKKEIKRAYKLWKKAYKMQEKHNKLLLELVRLEPDQEIDEIIKELDKEIEEEK